MSAEHPTTNQLQSENEAQIQPEPECSAQPPSSPMLLLSQDSYSDLVYASTSQQSADTEETFGEASQSSQTQSQSMSLSLNIGQMSALQSLNVIDIQIQELKGYAKENVDPFWLTMVEESCNETQKHLQRILSYHERTNNVENCDCCFERWREGTPSSSSSDATESGN
jgi:hypothetical protein